MPLWSVVQTGESSLKSLKIVLKSCLKQTVEFIPPMAAGVFGIYHLIYSSCSLCKWWWCCDTTSMGMNKKRFCYLTSVIPFSPIFTQWISAAAPHLNGCPSFFSGSVCDRPWILSLCSVWRVSPLYSFFPFRLFYLGKRGLGCDGGSTGEVMVVVAMVVVAAWRRRREAGNLLDHIPVQLWRLVQGGGWRAEQDHHCIAGHHEWSIVRWFAVSASLCHNFSLTERNRGEETEQRRDKERNLELIVALNSTRDENHVEKKIQQDRAWETVTHICASGSNEGGNSECDGDNKDWDDGDMDNGGIHIATLWRVCSLVISASTLFSHAYMSAVIHT